MNTVTGQWERKLTTTGIKFKSRNPKRLSIIIYLAFYFTITIAFSATVNGSKPTFKMATNDRKRVVVTGAGSGVGQAVALKMAKLGWHVAILGRRESALADTVNKAGEDASNLLVCPTDVASKDQVKTMKEAVLAKFGGVDALINSAGINVPNRKLEVLTDEDYQQVIQVNLTGAYQCVQAFLPEMRTQGHGTIVNIVSEAGVQANIKAGASYIMSKFGMDGLTQAINIEEREKGVRACSIYPGDINTPILDKRPTPPPMDVRTKMIQPEDIADCVLLVVNLPNRTTVEEILVRPTKFTS